MLTLFIVVAIFCVGGVKGNIDPHHLCDQILSINCDRQYIQGEPDEQICGTNKKTYKNFCDYSQARCMDRNIMIDRIGDCSATTMAPMTTMMMTETVTAQPVTKETTTPAPATTDQTNSALMQVFCSTKDSLNCDPTLDPICGSDKSFYLNKCEFSKATCDNPGLVIKTIPFCTGAR